MLPFLNTRYATGFQGNGNDNYGARASGWLVAPETGEYRIFLRSDDHGAVWISTDEDPENVELIAEQTGCCNGFTVDDGLLSGIVELEEGQKYYFEALLKEGGGGDWMNVQWRRPSEYDEDADEDMKESDLDEEIDLEEILNELELEEGEDSKEETVDEAKEDGDDKVEEAKDKDLDEAKDKDEETMDEAKDDEDTVDEAKDDKEEKSVEEMNESLKKSGEDGDEIIFCHIIIFFRSPVPQQIVREHQHKLLTALRLVK